jgi:hypothetical protein
LKCCSVYIFKQSSTIEFAGTSTTYAANSMKISITVQSWPFYALSNSLAIVMDAGFSNAGKTCINYYADQNTNLKWYTIAVGDVVLYPEVERSFPSSFSYCSHASSLPPSIQFDKTNIWAIFEQIDNRWENSNYFIFIE